jgi:parvulin-like peptidyl-prolyl isomerase
MNGGSNGAHSHRGRTRVLFAVCIAIAINVATADEQNKSAVAESDRVLATVNGRPIHERHVRREIGQVIAVDKLPADAAIRAKLTARTLELLIDRRVIVNALIRDKRAASDAEVKREVERAHAALDRIKKALSEEGRPERKPPDGKPESLQTVSDDDLRSEMQWRLSWRNLCETELGDAALAAYFEKHRRQFDGTRVRVRHILLAIPRDAAESRTRETVEQAAKLRQRIVAKEITFTDAAKQFSDGPSKRDGGDIGFITRHAEQHEAFAAAAFALAANEVSPPTRTLHGVHLIQCTEIKPGEKKLADVLELVRNAATKELFRTWAARERPKAKIDYADSTVKPTPADIMPAVCSIRGLR